MLKLNQKDVSNVCISCTCGEQTEFKGPRTPLICENCEELLPDGLAIHRSIKQRIIYHKDLKIFE